MIIPIPPFEDKQQITAWQVREAKAERAQCRDNLLVIISAGALFFAGLVVFATASALQ